MGTIKFNKGFTLIELVVVAGLVGILSIGIVNLFTSSVRGSQRARLQAEVKSQGDYALASMERQIRNAIATPVQLNTDKGVEFLVKETSEAAITQSYNIISGNVEFDPNANILYDEGGLFTLPVVVEPDSSITVVPSEGVDSGRVKITLHLVGTEGGLEVDQIFETTVAIRTIN